MIGSSRLGRAWFNVDTPLYNDVQTILHEDAPRASTFHASLAWFKAKAKRTYTTDWDRRVQNLPPARRSPGLHFALKGGEDTSNLRYPVSVNPTSAFIHTSRELWARGAQALTGHGYIGAYYQRMNFDQLYRRQCSPEVAVQTREHIARHCPRYAAHRHITDAGEDLDWEDWRFCRLGEPEVNLPALHEFCRRSGAFSKLGIPLHLNLILPPPPPSVPANPREAGLARSTSLPYFCNLRLTLTGFGFGFLFGFDAFVNSTLHPRSSFFRKCKGQVVWWSLRPTANRSAELHAL